MLPRIRSVLVALTAVTLPLAGMAAPVQAAPAGPAAPVVPAQRSTPVKPLKGDYSRPEPAAEYRAARASWPTGTADVPQARENKRAGSLPVWIRGSKAKAVHVEAASHAAATAAGVDGVLLSLRPSESGPAHLTLSYASFAGAYGGDWASRLRLVSLPACALTTPDVPACRVQTPLASTNDAVQKTLVADSVLSATTVVGATADSGGGNGDYSATSLKAAGSWQAGGSGDSFSWSYPITVPAVPGNLQPHIALSYNSQAQDGLISSTNNQASWIGDGWDYSPGFIERSYPSCHDNPAGSTKTWDSCWSAKNTLTLSLDGQSSALVLDDASGSYHPQNDQNEKVEHLPGAVNGAQGGEFWRVTTADGIQYYFGRNELPGWTSTSTATNSVWTEPVFETDAKRPCYNATFSKSFCQQAYRWNLDYVVDPHADTIAYFYRTDQNYYAAALGSTATAPYVRSGYLSKIQYGQRDGQVYSTSPAAQVTFTVNGRCDSDPAGCATSALTSTTAKDWPDVPFDAKCASAATCKNQSPTFWSTTMLTGIQTQALAGTTETPVDSWSLGHSFPDPQDLKSTASLWLGSITHTGKDTTAGPSGTAAITLPATVFGGTLLANRVKITNGYPPLTRMRVDTITTETGEKISVGYSTAVCPACVPSDPAQNTTLAYPAYWTPAGQSSPMLDWFNKYVVTAVTEQDTTDASADDDIVTTYTPTGKPAWHDDTSPLTPAAQRTWNQWRGFGGMTVSVGNAPDPITKTTYTYLRGMDGDLLTSTTHRSVTVGDSRGDAAIIDADQYAGVTYETQVLNGDDLVSDTITDPWSAATGTQSATGQHSFHTGSSRTRVFTPLAGGTTRTTEVDDTHDGYGRITESDDHGDLSTTADDTCVTTTFADNSTKWILDNESEQRSVKVSCAATPAVPGDVVSDQLTDFDDAGDPTTVKRLKQYVSGAPVYVTATTVADQYGRVTSATDAESRTTTTTYSPATGAAPTTVTSTDPLKHDTVTTYDPLRGLATSTTDAGGYVTSSQYDALGRLVAVFKPGRSTTSTPNLKYTYVVSTTGPSLVSTYTLNHDASGYWRSETLYDSLLRARETQTQTAGTGRVQTDVFYNTAGLKSGETGTYFNGSPIGSVIEPAQAGDIDSETAYTYDGAGRKTADISYHRGDETWRTTYTYGGNFVTVVPPAGSTPATAVSDARNNTILLRQYHAGVTPDYLHAPAGGYDDVRYGYTADGKTASETDAAGNSWAWKYDLLGNQIELDDPDTGVSSTTYDDDGKVATVTNADGRQVTYAYDADGRKTGLYDTTGSVAPAAGNALAAWTYDTVKKGLLTSTTSYSAGDTYTDTVLAYNLYGFVTAHRATLTGTDAGLLPAAGYVVSPGYEANGRPDGQNDAAIAGLPQETTGYDYDGIDQPIALTGKSAYVTAVGYTGLGQLAQYAFGAGTATGYETFTYDEQTRAPATTTVKGFGASGDIDNVSYTFGSATVSKGSGLLTKITDKRDGATVTDTQCFGYDYAQRLQQAWTATDNCAGSPAAGGSVAPYWQSWTYNADGDRATETDHGVTGAADTTTGYHYPAAGSATDQPHTLTGTTATGADATANTATFAYDKSGDTTAITGGETGDEKLTWTATSKVATATTARGTTTFGYAADGSQLVKRDPTTTTLYLGDQQIVMNNSTKALSGTRYYSINGNVVAARAGATAVSYLIADRQGTAQLSIAAATGTVTRRLYLPFGEVRGAAPASWPGTKGYVGGTTDATTGMETLGARQYDPSVGRFLSADPVFEGNDPGQMGGYAYAGNDPVVHSDPSGLRIDPDGKASDVAAVGDINFARKRSAEGSSSGSGGATHTHHVVALTPHVLIRDDDPYYPKLYTSLHTSRIGSKPLIKLKNEEEIWRWVCSSKGMCPKAMNDLLGGGNGSFLFPTNYHKATHVNGRVMGIMIGSGTRKDGFVRRLNDPDSMRGATEEEVDALARSSGLRSAPMKPTSATGGRGTRYFDPADDTVQVMFEAGDPAQADPVHQGPYLKYQVKGAGKAGAVRVPLDGNPNPDEGFTGSAPKTIAEWGSESLIEVIEDAVEEGGE